MSLVISTPLRSTPTSSVYGVPWAPGLEVGQAGQRGTVGLGQQDLAGDGDRAGRLVQVEPYQPGLEVGQGERPLVAGDAGQDVAGFAVGAAVRVGDELQFAGAAVDAFKVQAREAAELEVLPGRGGTDRREGRFVEIVGGDRRRAGAVVLQAQRWIEVIVPVAMFSTANALFS